MFHRCFSILLFYILLIVSDSIAKEVLCEKIEKMLWRSDYGNLTTCNMRNKTVIDADNTIISSTDESVEAIFFFVNPKIRYLPVEVSLKFPNLEVYNAFQCSLTTISKKNFWNLKKLRSLDLAENQIEMIRSDTFEDLTGLERLSLNRNKIKQMNGFALNKLTNLAEIWLQDNVCIDEKYEGDEDEDEGEVKNLLKKINEKCGFLESSKSNLKCAMAFSSRTTELDHLFDIECGEVASVRNRELDHPFDIECESEGDRMIGGMNTLKGDFPFLAALQKFEANKQGIKFFCTGTLVTSLHVITAAHCLQEKGSRRILLTADFEVLLGRFNLVDDFEPTRVHRKIREAHIHPDYKTFDPKYDADIAILTLNETVEFTSFIQPACLSNDPKVEELCDGEVVGWGITENGNLSLKCPRKVDLIALNDSYCYTSDHEFARISSLRTFCAAGMNAGPCSGDSGGGFFVKNVDSYILRGIVSNSMKNNEICDVARYTVFTKVIDFTDWISKIIGDVS